MSQGLSEPEFHGDFLYKLKKIVGTYDCSVQFIKLISHYKNIGFNSNILRHTACLVVNPIMVDNLAFLFNCTSAGLTSVGFDLKTYLVDLRFWPDVVS